MPIYEYECLTCETRFEKLVRSQGQEIACPSCASPQVDKQPSTFRMGRSDSGGARDYGAGPSSSSSCASCSGGNCSTCR